MMIIGSHYSAVATHVTPTFMLVNTSSV